MQPSRDLNIVWVWGIDKLHEKGTHEYAWVMDTYMKGDTLRIKGEIPFSTTDTDN